MTWNFDRCSYKDTKDFSLHACTKFNLKKSAYLFKKEVMLDCTRNLQNIVTIKLYLSSV